MKAFTLYEWTLARVNRCQEKIFIILRGKGPIDYIVRSFSFLQNKKRTYATWCDRSFLIATEVQSYSHTVISGVNVGAFLPTGR